MQSFLRSRKTLLLTIVVVAVLCGSVFAYWVSLPSHKTAGPSVSITSTPLQLSIGLDKTEYATTDNLTLYFSLRNISNKTVTVEKTFGSTLGTEPLVPTYTLTTSTEGVSTPGDPNEVKGFQFGFTWLDSNGTVVEHQPEVMLAVVYDILLEPSGCLNQTLYISITDFYGISGQPAQTGAFQIQGSLPRVLVDGVGPITLETPSISFAIEHSLPLTRTMGPSVSITSSPFELSIALDKTAYSLDDNMTTSFYLRNISNETITVEIPDITGVSPNDPAITLATVSEGVNTSFNEPGEDPFGGLFPFRYTFVASNGTIIYEFPSTGLPETYSIVFEPGASLNQTLYVNLSKYSEIRTAPSGHPLQKGSYQVDGAFEAGLIDKGLYTWETPSITFTLR